MLTACSENKLLWYHVETPRRTLYHWNQTIFWIKEGKLIYVCMWWPWYGVAKELGHHLLKLAHPATASAEDCSHHQYLHLSFSSSVLERKVLIRSEKWHWQANSLINPRETISLGHAWKLFWQLEPSIWRCLVQNISFTTGKEMKRRTKRKRASML